MSGGDTNGTGVQRIEGSAGNVPIAPRRSRMPMPSTPRPFVFPTFRDDSEFERQEKIGQGTFGTVYKCKAPDGSTVALKALRLDDSRNGISVTSVREIQILQSLHHENIISILDIVASKDAHDHSSESTVYLVFPYLEHDLSGLLENTSVHFSPPIVKCFFKQILTGLAHIHQRGYMHRDIKSANILIDNRGNVKLADFGLARPLRTDDRKHTDKVVTMWYRGPELLLGYRNYDQSLDMWSLGCVFGEMLTRRPLFHGSTEMDQLDRIFRLCGSPPQSLLDSSGASPSILPKHNFPRQVKKRFLAYGSVEADLLDLMLQVDPKKRITASEALQHRYFTTDPLPYRPDQVPQFQISNEWIATQKKQNMLKRHRPDAVAVASPRAVKPVASPRPVKPTINAQIKHHPVKQQRLR